jgi:endoglucanase
MTVKLDGRAVATTAVAATAWTTYGWTGMWQAGKHTVSIGFSNDRWTATCDRNLRVDYVAFRSATAPPGDGNLFTKSLYVDPSSTPATRAAALQAAGDSVDATRLHKIADHPMADWFTDATPTASIGAAVRARVDKITSSGRMPVLVAYAIPQRDCGGQSSGGLATAAAYQTWISNFASGIASRSAVVILEPDSLAQWDCLDSTAQANRLASLRSAVAALSASHTVAVYLDGGHANWQSVTVMASRLKGAGVADVRGFATNVANFDAQADEVSYGNQLASALGGKHFVVDTSRNGLGPGSTWCNPAGRALGSPATSHTTSASADAYFWIKRPGESDGACSPGDPAAGAWYESYALELAANATF